MLIYYASLSGNVRRFVERLPDSFTVRNIKDYPIANEPYILLTYTFGFGQVPEQVKAWLASNSSYMLGVGASGNKNWGDLFAKAGDVIATKYGVPMLLKFELSGTEQDRQEFIRKAKALYDDLF